MSHEPFTAVVFAVAFIAVHIGIGALAESVGLYLGVPFAAGVLTRLALRRMKGDEWCRTHFIPRISPLTLIALLFTIVVMFSLKGRPDCAAAARCAPNCRAASRLLRSDFPSQLWMGKRLGADYAQSATLSFTAAGNNFELAIAVAVAVFGLHSGEAFVGIVTASGSACPDRPRQCSLVDRRRYFKETIRPIAG
jgi:arsenite transporter